MAYFWGFTVDDALVSGRIAAHLAQGAGYRFNVDGPVVDAVTPLGWALLLVPFASRGALSAVNAARWLGAAAWLGASFWLGVRVAQGGQRWVRFAPLLLLPLCAPLGAWAVAGMETGVVLLLATLALARSRWHILAAGLAAAWRPELGAWAVVLVAGRTFVESKSAGRAAASGLLAAAPSILVAVVRAAVFSSPAPLAVLAKPSDLQSGLFYAAAAFIWTGVAWLVLRPLGVARVVLRVVWSAAAPSVAVPGWARRDESRISDGGRAVLVAAGAHLVAMVLAGGDWMTLFRLAVPVLPSLLLVAAEVAEASPIWATAIRTLLGAGLSMWLAVDLAPAARSVWQNRVALVSEAAPYLASARAVAALDVGWVGAATSSDIVDLAGITDRAVAALPGGHTSKQLPSSFLRGRHADHLVLALPPGQSAAEPWYTSWFERRVERTVAEQAFEQDLVYRKVATLRVGDTGRTYLVLRMAAGEQEHD